jgi:hypothetical protein
MSTPKTEVPSDVLIEEILSIEPEFVRSPDGDTAAVLEWDTWLAITEDLSRVHERMKMDREARQK